VHTPDPVGAGFVNSMSRPGGNATGFINFEYGMGAKWLELLKQIEPSVTRLHDTSVVMIERTYSKFIADHSDAVSRRALLEPPDRSVGMWSP
jgi:hypothetical protein